MAISSPAAETARFIATILSARETPVAELNGTIAAIHDALRGLRAPVEAPPLVPVAPVVAPRRRRAAKPAAAPIEAAPVVAVAPVAAPEPEPMPEKRGRGRPRREPLVASVEMPEPEAVVAPPQPKLLRRAQVQAAEPETPSFEVAAAARVPGGQVRGVVKWYDGRAGKGVLRLTGVSGDVPIDPAVLARAGIKRLYKDQEIEATIDEKGGRVRLTGLSLPGRNREPAAASGAEEIPSILRRPRQVLVEVKRDGVRQRAARAEAEQVLGGSRPTKASRRLTP